MQQFDLYSQAWGLYLLLGLVLLFLLDLKLRKTGFKRRVAVLSLIAAGAFTPSVVTDADSYAPIIITLLLDAEIQGLPPVIEGFTRLLIVWGALFFIVLAVRQAVRTIKSKKANDVENTDSAENNDAVENNNLDGNTDNVRKEPVA